MSHRCHGREAVDAHGGSALAGAQVETGDPRAGGAVLGRLKGQPHAAAAVRLHAQVCMHRCAAFEEAAPRGSPPCRFREGLEGERGPVLLLHPQSRGVREHEEAATPVPHGLPLEGLLRRDPLRPGDHGAVPCVLPIAGRNPDLPARHIEEEVEDGRNEHLAQEDVLPLRGAGWRELRPQEVAPRREREARERGLVSGGDERRQHLVAHVEVGLEDGLHRRPVSPWPVVRAVQAEHRAKGAMRDPPEEAARARARVAAAVRVDKRLQVVQARVHHRLHACLQVHAVARPPDRVAVLPGALLVALRVHPGPPIRLPELRERHGPAVEGVAGRIADDLVELRDRAEVDMGAPRGVVQAEPSAVRLRGVDKGRGDGEAPVVVEPPKGQAACHPLAEALPTEVRLLRGGLETAGAPAGDWEGVVVEVCAEAVSLQEAKPLREVGEEVCVGVAIVPVHLVVRPAPVHVQGPNIDGQLVALPACNVLLRLRLGVAVPPREPSAVSVVRQQGHGAA
mmetsp:Transcript_79764/g.247387  ORF Transcript_79764/g.247387 Transcript_79764/m.247387 type:complete len:509 (+) Transcript_79764:252-1778(+)